MSKAQGKFDFSIHDPFRIITPRRTNITVNRKL